MAYDSKPRDAVNLYVGDKYIQQNPNVADGLQFPLLLK